MAAANFSTRISQLMAVLSIALVGYLVLIVVEPFAAQRTYEISNARGTVSPVITVPFGLRYQAFANGEDGSRTDFVLIRDRVSRFNKALEEVDCPKYLATKDHRTSIELRAYEGKGFIAWYVASARGGEIVEDAPIWKPKEERGGYGHYYVAVLERDESGFPSVYATCFYGAVPASVTLGGGCQVIFPISSNLYGRALLENIDRPKWPEQIEVIKCFVRSISRDIS